VGPLGLRQKYDEDVLNGNRSQQLDRRFKSSKGCPKAPCVEQPCNSLSWGFAEFVMLI
jgi:hypothetical protein